MREMKDSGVEWIGEIPNKWEMIKNKYNFELSKQLIGNKWEETQLLSLTKKGIKMINDGEQTGKVPASLSTYQKVSINDIVMCLFDLDVSAVFSGISPYNGMISPAYKCFSCKPHLKPKYVDYYFQTVFVDRKYKRYSKNVRYSISADEFMALPIIVPPFQEQSRIASFLDSKCSEIDSLHSDIEEEIETLKEYKKSVITEAVTKGLNPNVEMKDSGIEWIGEIPKEWKCKKIKYSCKTRYEKYNLTKGKLNYFALENIKSWNFSFIKTENEYDLNNSQLCYKNDVVFGKLRPYLAKTFLVDYDRCCSSEFAVFHQFDGIPKYFLYVFTSQSFVKIVDDSTAGVKMPRANINFINNVLIPVPSKKEQTEIVNYLDSKCSEIDSIIESKQQQLATLEQYKKSLIYEYVTGKKEVPYNA